MSWDRNDKWGDVSGRREPRVQKPAAKLELQDGIPVPNAAPPRNNKGYRSAMRAMQPGQSVFMATKKGSIYNLMAIVRYEAEIKKLPEPVFVLAEETAPDGRMGYRVWRTS